MEIQRMSERQRLALRKKCLRSLFAFCVGVMGYDDISETLHGSYCKFLESPSRRKQVTLPRSFVKTWIGTIAYSIWITLPRVEEDEFPYPGAWEDKFWKLGPDMRILIASYVISNAEKMISLIRRTYEANTAMQILFPEVIPHNFKKVKWSNQSACINRTTDFTESTFEAAGIGGASISRHYDLIIEDDLIYAKKDDLTGQELQPNQEDIDKAIGWHKLSTSLLVPGNHTRIHNIGTRWTRHDLVDYIWTNEPEYQRFIQACVDLNQLKEGKPWFECTPTWKKCYPISELKRIADAQGSYIFSTQMLLAPRSPQETLFKREYLRFYTLDSEVPKTLRKFTTVDLAGWGTSTRAKQSRAVVLTCGWDHLNHCWILHYDVGRFDPTDVIEIIAKHYRIFSPEGVFVESVYYQKSLVHFARKSMEDGKIPWIPIRQIKPEHGESKELRIRAIEPIASNFALHCKPSHKDFINEFVDYVPNNNTCVKDILDALGYQVQVARPATIEKIPKKRDPNDIMPLGTIDQFLEMCWRRSRPIDIFGHRLPTVDPYTDPLAQATLDALPPEVPWEWNDESNFNF
mgnify:CR=1 FL=1